jgi:DNA helicase-2/ATP-dependent DNA helicase PcrA
VTSTAPSALGRGVVVTAGGRVPAPWSDDPVVVIDDGVLADPAAVVGSLHGHWSRRQPVVIALAVDPASFRAPQSVVIEPWRVGPAFEPWHDRLHFLVWANTCDARDGEPIWWWARKAQRLGATPVGPGQPGDCLLEDGTPVWVDGGPRVPLAAEDLGGAQVVHRESVELERLAVEPQPVDPTAALAPDQLAAVGHGAGPARIIAPAGSGKTRVLTERLRHLLVDRGYERATVLAVAYNKRAQEEMLARTTDIRPRVQTLNALAYEILGQARGGRPRVLDELQVRGILERLVPKGRPMANTDRLAPYLEALTAVRLGLRDPEEVEASREDVPGFAGAFDGFRRQLADMRAVDFDEQVYAAVEVVLADGSCAVAPGGLPAPARRRAPGPDAGPRPAAPPPGAPGLDVFGVGDDDQTIYSYAGADPRFLIDFAELFPGGGAHPLEVNYRCPTAVVDGARTLLSYNRCGCRRTSGPARRPTPIRARCTSGGTGPRPAPPPSSRSSPVAGGGADRGRRRRARPRRVLLLAPQVALVEAGVPVVPAVDTGSSTAPARARRSPTSASAPTPTTCPAPTWSRSTAVRRAACRGGSRGGSSGAGRWTTCTPWPTASRIPRSRPRCASSPATCRRW